MRYQAISQNNPFLRFPTSVWDASNPLENSSSIPADNAQVASFRDLGSPGNNFAQGFAVNRPMYKTNIVNGNNIVRFDGSNDSMSCTHATGNDYSGAMTIIAAIYPASVTGTHRLFTKSASSGDGFTFGTVDTQLIFTAKGVTDYQTAVGVVDLNTWQIIAMTYNGSNSVSFYKNRALVSTHAGGAINATNGNLILGANLSGMEYFQGDLQNIAWLWRVANAGELAILLDAACKRVGL